MSLFKDVNVVQYSVTHWEAAKKFYSETLEWPVVWSSDEIGWMEFGREHETHFAINLWRGPGEAPPRNGSVIAVLSVENAHAATATLRAKGIKCDDVVDIPNVVSYGGFYDPEGNRIQFAGPPPKP